MPVENGSSHPAAIVRHAMHANPAVCLRQVEIANIAVEFPILAPSVWGQRIARELIEALNLGLQLLDCYLFHRSLFSIVSD